MNIQKNRPILERFTDKSNTIVLLMEEDAKFHALCEDYNICVEALRYWSASQEHEAKTRVNEYSTLVRELEQEIAQALEELEPRCLE